MFKPFVILGCLAASSLWANGSPIDYSAFKKAGQIEPTQVSEVSLLKETLALRVFKDWVQVRVVYTLSAPNKDLTVAYGFPLNTQQGYSEDSSDAENEFEAVRGTTFTLDDKRLQHSIRYTQSKNKGTIWATSELPLKKGQTSVLQVDYLVRAELEDSVFTKSFKPRFEDRSFTYSFKLASNWSKSTPDIDVSVDLTQIGLEGGKLKKASPKPHSDHNGLLSWSWKKADLQAMQDLVIKYDRSDSLFREYIEANREFIRPWHLELAADEGPTYKFKAPTPVSEAHPWSNLFDRSLRKAYAVPWTGKPLRIELTAPSIHGLGILNGYMKDEATYRENARIRSCEVKVWIPGFAKLFNDSADLKKPQVKEYELPDRPWKDFNPLEPWRSLDWIVDLGDVPGPMIIEITVTDVYPGTKYQDLCLTEMFLVK